MRVKLLMGLLVSAVVFASAGRGQDTNVLGFDMIYDMPFVNSLEFGPDGRELLVAVEGNLLHWQLDPLTLVSHQEISILANDMLLTKDQKLYAVGLDWNTKTFRRGGGKAAVFERNPDAGGTFEIEDVNTFKEVSEHSTIALNSAGVPILGSASSFGASSFVPTRGLAEGGTIKFPQLRFRCGGVTQLSIFQIEGEDHYIGSTANAAALEIGRVDAGKTRSLGGDCFEALDLQKGERRKPTYDALRHAVIDLGDSPMAEDGVNKAVLVLDPNTNHLQLFRIEAFSKSYFLTRRGGLEIDLTGFLPKESRGAVLTDMATDAQAREIHISSNAAEVVLRFGFDGTELKTRGRFKMGAPVQRLKMSKDGKIAAIVTGRETFGGDWRIALITNPAALWESLQIPDSFRSIRALQESLNESGYDAGFPDGILGPQTTTAVSEFWGKARENPQAADKPLQRAVISSFPTYIIDAGASLSGD